MGRLLLALGYACIALVLLGVGVLGWGYAEFTRPGPLSVSKVAVIPRGSGLEQIANTLAQAGIIQHAEVFAIGTKLSGGSRDLKAGEYRFPERVSPRGVMDILTAGRTVARRLTVAEGLTVAQILAKLDASDGLTGKPEQMPAEGSLLPETYHYSFGDERAALIGRMEEGMRRALAELWPQRQPNLPIETPEQAVILASIIERESGIADERPLIAGVFVNRLRRGMRLQSDPTVAYGIAPEGLGRPLTRADLARPSPYNTYIISGLPPAPICNPGKAAIRAALNPAKTDFLYFVADGTGGHAFAKTLREHNRNVVRWRRSRKPSSN